MTPGWNHLLFGAPVFLWGYFFIISYFGAVL